MEKIQALANYLEENVEEIEELDHNTFVYGNEEFYVLDEEEADEMAVNDIREMVWAFNADFIVRHSTVLQSTSRPEHYVAILADECEGANELFLALLDDFEDFADDAINSDGRGHFISSYDGEEVEQDDYFIYRIN